MFMLLLSFLREPVADEPRLARRGLLLFGWPWNKLLLLCLALDGLLAEEFLRLPRRLLARAESQFSD